MTTGDVETVNVKELTRDERALAALGYKQEYKRYFSLVELCGLAFSFVTTVPGIASVLFYPLPNGGAASLVWGWFVACIFIFFVGLSIAELGSAAPTSGGLYYLTYTYASPRWRNLLSWIVGYSSTFELIAGLASVAWSAALQIAACASIGSGFTWFPTTAQLFGISVALVIFQATIASCKTRIMARLQNFILLANMLLILFFIIAVPVATPKQFRNTAKFAFTDFQNLNGWPNGFAFFLGMVAPVWTVAGFDQLIHVSEEATNAATGIPFATIFCTVSGGILGWILCIVIALFMGQDVSAILSDPTGQPMATILNQSVGPKATFAFLSFTIIILFSTGVNVCMTISRQAFALARDGALPFSKFLYHMNSYTRTPLRAVWTASAISIILLLLVFAGSSAINAVFSLFICAQNTSYSIAIASKLFGANTFKPGPFNLGRWSMPIGLISITWQVVMTVVFLFPATPTGINKQTFNYTIVAYGGWMLLSLTWYFFPKFGGMYWFQGPVPNLRAVSKENVSGSAGSTTKESLEEKRSNIAESH